MSDSLGCAYLNRHRSDNPPDDPEPVAECDYCGKAIWCESDVILTATGSIVGDQCCVQHLLDGDCDLCHKPVLKVEYVEHLTEEHGQEEEIAKRIAAGMAPPTQEEGSRPCD